MTERVNTRPLRPVRGTSPIGERQDPHPSRACGGRTSHLPRRGRLWGYGLPHQSADWFAMTCGIRSASKKCGRPHPALRATFSSQEKALRNGLPHQCEHWFAMTTSIFVHFSSITGRENPALLFYFSTTGGWSGDRWSPHPDSRCPGATGQYWRCPGKR